MPWGVAAAAAIGVVGSSIAGGEQASADQSATAAQQGMFNTITGNEQPYLSAGNSATQTLSQLLGTAPATGAGGTAGSTGLAGGYLTQTFDPTMASLENTPGYQFALSQGDQAVQNSAAASTGAVSGSALKSLSTFNQGLASTQYQNLFNNFQTQQNNIFNRLSSIASLGQNAAGNLGNSGAQLGTGMAQSTAAAGAAKAGGIVGATNSASQGALLSALMGGPSTSGYQGLADNYDDQAASSLNNIYGNNPLPGYCDYALKSCIEPYRFNGTANLMVYDFEYKDDPGRRHRGYIAQEVEPLYPEAVSRGPKGFLMVDYSKVPGWDELDAMAKEQEH